MCYSRPDEQERFDCGEATILIFVCVLVVLSGPRSENFLGLFYLYR